MGDLLARLLPQPLPDPGKEGAETSPMGRLDCISTGRSTGEVFVLREPYRGSRIVPLLDGSKRPDRPLSRNYYRIVPHKSAASQEDSSEEERIFPVDPLTLR